MFQRVDVVGRCQDGRPMCCHDHGQAAAELAQGSDKGELGELVEDRCRLVEENNPRSRR